MKIFLGTFIRHGIDEYVRSQFGDDAKFFYCLQKKDFNLRGVDGFASQRNLAVSLSEMVENISAYFAHFDTLLKKGNDITFYLVHSGFIPHAMVLLASLKNRYRDEEINEKVSIRGLLFDKEKQRYIEYGL